MTFSIAGRDPETGELGIAISSSSMAVGARCPWLRAKVGAVSSQNITLPAIGTWILDALGAGATPETALRRALERDAFAAYRQVTVLSADGRTATHSGSKTLGTHRAGAGVHCMAAGNMLARPQVVDAMVGTFERTGGTLADRLLAAMLAGLGHGGEAGPVHSAALKIVGDVPWPEVDLRVDWTDTAPIETLAKLWHDYQPQRQDYVTRALDPTRAPSYGVPGDE